jgi:hypothetical protein
MPTPIATVSSALPVGTPAPVARPSAVGAPFTILLETMTAAVASADPTAPLTTGKDLPTTPTSGNSLPDVAPEIAKLAAKAQLVATAPLLSTPLLITPTLVGEASLGDADEAQTTDEEGDEKTIATPTAEPAPLRVLAVASAIVALLPIDEVNPQPTVPVDIALGATSPEVMKTSTAKPLKNAQPSALILAPTAEGATILPSPTVSTVRAASVRSAAKPLATEATPAAEQDRPTIRSAAASDPIATASPQFQLSPASSSIAPLATLAVPTTPTVLLSTPANLAPTDLARPDHHAAVEALTRARGDDGVAGLLQLRNHDFGAISVRFETSGSVLHAKLGNDDPDFRPTIIAAAETATSPRTSAAEATGHRPGDRQPSDNQSTNQHALHRHGLADNNHAHSNTQSDKRAPDVHPIRPTLSLLPRSNDEATAPAPRGAGGIFA